MKTLTIKIPDLAYEDLLDTATQESVSVRSLAARIVSQVNLKELESCIHCNKKMVNSFIELQSEPIWIGVFRKLTGRSKQSAIITLARSRFRNKFYYKKSVCSIKCLRNEQKYLTNLAKKETEKWLELKRLKKLKSLTSKASRAMTKQDQGALKLLKGELEQVKTSLVLCQL